MRHFIEVTLKVVKYCYNNKNNKIGDFGYYFCSNYGEWYKDRLYRGKCVYSKKPHYENGTGYKAWWHSECRYYSYEEYLLAIMK